MLIIKNRNSLSLSLSLSLRRLGKQSIGFTLIELVMVIVILGVLAGISIPMFVNLKTAAILKSEDAIIGALGSAIKSKQMENIANGMEPEAAWPCQDTTNPFTLLAQAPPYLASNDWVAGSQDNYNWHTRGSGLYWFLGCPHYNGTYQNVSATKGRFYIYQQGVYSPGWGHFPGDLWKHADYGH